MKYADKLVLLPKEEMVLEVMIHNLPENGRLYGMEMNDARRTAEIKPGILPYQNRHSARIRLLSPANCTFFLK